MTASQAERDAGIFYENLFRILSTSGDHFAICDLELSETIPLDAHLRNQSASSLSWDAIFPFVSGFNEDWLSASNVKSFTFSCKYFFTIGVALST